MYRSLKFFLGLALFFPVVSSADSLVAGEVGGFGRFVQGVVLLINGYLIPLLIAVAVLAFIWGVIKYFILNSDNEESRTEGKMLMLYSIIGFVVIVTLWSIVGFVASAFGVTPGETIGGYPIGPGPTGG